jgi:hypothetical protein
LNFKFKKSLLISLNLTFFYLLTYLLTYLLSYLLTYLLTYSQETNRSDFTWGWRLLQLEGPLDIIDDWTSDSKLIQVEKESYGLWTDDKYYFEQADIQLTESQLCKELNWNRANHYQCMQMHLDSPFETTPIADYHPWSLCYDMNDYRPDNASMDYCIYLHLDHSDTQTHVCLSMTSYLEHTKTHFPSLRQLAYLKCPSIPFRLAEKLSYIF